MLFKLALLSTLTLAGSAFAQCGLNQLTTPPNFVSNNGGAVGGMAYFTLDVTAGNGVSICGIDINTSVAVGATFGGSVYRHLTITDHTLLTGATNTPADWETIACITGTSAGLNAPSACVVVNGTGTIDLAPGQHLIAIGNGTFNHRYTNGTGTNEAIADANLGFVGGLGANVVYSPTFFNPRIFNGTFDYDVPGAPVSTSPGGVNCAASSCAPVGTGCGAVADPAHIYEDFNGGTFDLSGATGVRFTGSGSDVLSIPIPNAPINAPISPDLGLGDDQNSPLIPLGFNLAQLGLPCVDSISVASNGYIWLGALGAADFSESALEFHAQGARVAVLWDDLNPAAGGTIHVDSGGGGVVVTWLNVFYFGGAAPGVTMQCTITPSGIDCSYDPSTVFNDAGIVGFANGFPQAVTPASDLSAAPVGPFASGGFGDLTLSCVASPLIGGALDVALSNVPDGGIGAVGASFGVAQPAVALAAPFFSPNCNSYIPVLDVVFGGVSNASSCDSYPFSIAIPNDPFWIGTQVVTQGWALNIASGKVSSSNAMDSTVGNF